MLYLDTSLLVAALTHQTRTAEVQDWLAAQNPDELAISEWTVTEFSSAMSIKVRTGQLASDHRADALVALADLIDNSFWVWPVSRLDFRTAARFADQHETGLRAGDALHLAIAANHGGRVCTLDRLLAQAAPALGVSAALLYTSARPRRGIAQRSCAPTRMGPSA